MFADYFTIKLGDTSVKGRRLTIKEVKALLPTIEDLSNDDAVKIVKGHCTLADGSAFDPEELTGDQLRKLVGELVLPEKGRSISDFIGLLCQ